MTEPGPDAALLDRGESDFVDTHVLLLSTNFSSVAMNLRHVGA